MGYGQLDREENPTRMPTWGGIRLNLSPEAMKIVSIGKKRRSYVRPNGKFWLIRKDQQGSNSTLRTEPNP